MQLRTKNSAFKANVASLIVKIVSVIGPLILVPLFVKYLTLEEYGIWLIVLSITSFFFLTNVGILQVVTNAIAKDISMEKVDYYSQVVFVQQNLDMHQNLLGINIDIQKNNMLHLQPHN